MIFSPIIDTTAFLPKVGELKAYLKRLGAEISEEKSSVGLEDDLRQVIDVCEFCFKEQNESDVEMVLNDVVSLLVTVICCACVQINAYTISTSFSIALSCQ